MTNSIDYKIDISPRDLAFQQAIKVLENIKLVLGGNAVLHTLRKRPVLKKFLNEYIYDHHSKFLNEIEETIADLDN